MAKSEKKKNVPARDLAARKSVKGGATLPKLNTPITNTPITNTPITNIGNPQ
jgi:hypothetical protein